MKKTLLILLTILILVAILAACSGVADIEEMPTSTEAETSEPESTATDAGVSINIADIMGRNFDDYQHLFGNVIGRQTGGSTAYDTFDSGITLGTNSNGGTSPDWIHIVYVQFREPENVGVASFADDEGFLGFEKSQRFHFNGIGHESTQADVAAAFPAGYFNWAYVRELAVLGEYRLQEIGPPVQTGATIEIDLLESEGESWLVGRLNSVIYWNDYFAIIFDFCVDGKVIDILVFSDIRD